MNDRQKTMIGAAIIIIILLLLVGAYAMNGSKNTTATPTPTPVPSATATPTPVPQGGAGAGTGTTTPTATPAPTATPTPTIAPTSTPKPTSTVGVEPGNSAWPLYNYHWSITPTPTPTYGPSTVGFNDWECDVNNGGEAGPGCVADNLWNDVYNYHYLDLAESSPDVVIMVQLNRTGDLSNSYTVPVAIGSPKEDHTVHTEILGYVNAKFASGESTANMSIKISGEFVGLNGYDYMTFTILPSSDYNVITPMMYDGYPYGNVYYLSIND